jgi:dynein intermediate chain
MDVGWSPVHPALFASADLTGKLSFWNLNTDTEVPISSIQVGNGLESALNRLSWHQSGQIIATASRDGKVSIFELGDSIAAPSVEESSRLNQTLNDMYQTIEDSQPQKQTKRFDL